MDDFHVNVSKVAFVVTDNASNFRKAFTTYTTDTPATMSTTDGAESESSQDESEDNEVHVSRGLVTVRQGPGLASLSSNIEDVMWEPCIILECAEKWGIVPYRVQILLRNLRTARPWCSTILGGPHPRSFKWR